jgi:hypothetical protein
VGLRRSDRASRSLSERYGSLGFDVADSIEDHPFVVSGALAAVFLVYTAYRIYDPLPAGTWPGMRDSVIFEYVGWYLWEGHRLYLDVWEIKPPLAFELTAAFAAMTGADVVGYHSLNVLANCVAIVLSAGLTARLVDELTDDAPASIVAGVAPFALPFYAFRALIGFKAKYFVVLAGIACLYLAYRDRPALAGAAGVAAVGFWQLAICFPIVALGYCYQVDRRRGAIRFLGGVTAVAAIVLAPIAFWGAIPAMVAETLLAPTIVSEEHDLLGRLALAIRGLDAAVVVVAFGLFALAIRSAGTDRRRLWPLASVAGWLTLSILLFDYDATPDLVPLLSVCAVGTGIGIATLRSGLDAGAVRTDIDVGALQRSSWTDAADGAVPPDFFPAGARLVGATILLLAVISVGTVGGYGVDDGLLTDVRPYDTQTEVEPTVEGARTYNATERQYVYWHREDLSSCRALGGYTQTRLVNEAGMAEDERWYDVPCGQFEPLWEAALGTVATG